MAQTQASKDALSRDGFLCQWCLRKEHRTRNVFAYVGGYHPMSGGSHHILSRRKVDDERAILGLCSKHHTEQETQNRPSKEELAELMLEVYGYNLWELWPQYLKPRSDDE